MSKLIFNFSDDVKKRIRRIFEREEELARRGVPFRTVCAGRMDELMRLSDTHLALFKEYIIEDAGDLDPAQADFVVDKLCHELSLNVTVVGRRCDDSGKVPAGAMVFLARADEISRIEDEPSGSEVGSVKHEAGLSDSKPEGFVTAPVGTDTGFGRDDIKRGNVVAESERGVAKPEYDGKSEKVNVLPESFNDEPEMFDDEPQISPELAMFLEADTASDRLDVFRRIREKCDDHMIDTIAVILDMEISQGDIERRRRDVMTCLETKIKYELTRR